MSFDGTSASAPAFAALISRLNGEQLLHGRPRLGLLNPWLYQACLKRMSLCSECFFLKYKSIFYEKSIWFSLEKDLFHSLRCMPPIQKLSLMSLGNSAPSITVMNLWLFWFQRFQLWHQIPSYLLSMTCIWPILSLFLLQVVVGDTASTESRLCPFGFRAAPGWDPPTGLGVPRFSALRELLPNFGSWRPKQIRRSVGFFWI